MTRTIGFGREKGMDFDFSVDKLNLSLTLTMAGEDASVCIFGGDRPHIGCTALAVPHPGISDRDKMSSTVSVINVAGHRDGLVAEYCAKKLSSERGCVVTVSCGIHYEKFDEDIKRELFEKLDILCEEISERLKKE